MVLQRVMVRTSVVKHLDFENNSTSHCITEVDSVTSCQKSVGIHTRCATFLLQSFVLQLFMF
jgi:hypothetical protein